MWRWLSYLGSLSFLWTMSMVISETDVQRNEDASRSGRVRVESAPERGRARSARVAERHMAVPREQHIAERRADRTIVSADEKAILLSLELLEEGIQRLQKESNYRARFFKHERIDGVLQAEQEMDLRLRHEPLSVALRCLDSGRRVVYVEGRHDNKIRVRMTGFQAFLGTLELNPTGTLAMQESRYPIYEIGMLQLAERIQDHRQYDLSILGKVTCRVDPDAELDERACYRFEVEYSHPQFSRGYRKSIFAIDKQWGVPLSVRNYVWPKSGASEAGKKEETSTLVEYYVYRDVKFGGCDERKDFDL